jgi:hypothetical protein
MIDSYVNLIDPAARKKVRILDVPALDATPHPAQAEVAS